MIVPLFLCLVLLRTDMNMFIHMHIHECENEPAVLKHTKITEFHMILRNFGQFRIAYGVYGSELIPRRGNSVNTLVHRDLSNFTDRSRESKSIPTL
jgi:hypothetical protein